MSEVTFTDASGNERLRGVLNPPPAGSQDLASVLNNGIDGNSAGMTNTGAIFTGGGNVVSDGGNISTAGGDILTATGEIDSGGGDINSGGGDLLTGGGDLRLGSTFRINANATIAGSSGAAFLGNVATVAAGGTKPELPATPLPQDIADALVALGLVTQAS